MANWLSWFRRENRSGPELDANGGNVNAVWNPQGGEDISANETLALSLPAVYTCVTYISDKVAGFPIDIFRRNANGTEKQIKTPQWLVQPCLSMTSMDFWGGLANSYELHGNAFALIQRDALDNIIELIPVDQAKVTAKVSGADTFYMIEGDEKSYIQGKNILHIRGMVLPGSVMGVSPIQVHARTIMMGVHAEQFGSDFYKYGLNLSGIIQMPKDEKITTEEAERLRKQFVSKHQGSTGSSAVGVLTGGAEWKQITLSPADAQFLESRKYTAVQIANIYHVPGYLVDPSVTSTWGTGIAEQNQMLVSSALEPLTTRIEQAVTTFLLPANQYMKMNMGALLKGDIKTQTDVLIAQVQGGLITSNEARRLLDQPVSKDPGADMLVIPLNIASLGIATEKGLLELESIKLENELLRKQLAGGNTNDSIGN